MARIAIIDGHFDHRSARLTVTMALPSRFHRLCCRAHGPKGFERNILALAAIHKSARHRRRWLSRLRTLGRRGR